MVRRPERQCIGCGRRGPQSEFLRLAVEMRGGEARVLPAGAGGHVGRGAYLCRRQACLDRALHRNAFQRAFRRAVVVAEEDIAVALMTEAER